MSGSAASLSFNILAKDMTARGFKSAADGAKKLGAGIKLGIGALGLAGAGAAAKEFIDIASDISESTSKVNTLLGKSAGAALKYADAAAATAGMSKTEALEAVGAMSAVQIAMGRSQEESAKLSAEYVQLSADLGSFNNASSEEVQEALTNSISGEYEMLKKYGIVVNDSTLAVEAQRIGMKKAGATWSSAQKQQLSYNIIMASTKAAQGDFARTSGGLANQTKILTAQFTNMKGELGAKLLPVAVGFVSILNKYMIPALYGIGRTLKPIGKYIGVFFNALRGKSELNEFDGGLRKANNAGVKISMWIREDFLPVAKRFVSWFKNDAIPAVKAFVGRVVGALKPVIIEIARIIRTQVIPAAKAFVAKLKEFWPTAQRLLKGIGLVVEFLVKKVVPIILRIVGPILGKLLRTWVDIFGKLTKPIEKLTGFFVRNWDKMRFGAAKAIKAIGGGLLTMADVSLGVIEGLLRGAGKLPKWLGGGKFDDAADAVAGIRSGIKQMKDSLDSLPTSKKMEIELAGVERAKAEIAEIQRASARGIYLGVSADKLDGARASGGPVRGGGAYLVGENGPEIFRPASSGTIIPNHRIASKGAGAKAADAVHLAVRWGSAWSSGVTLGVKSKTADIDAAITKVIDKLRAKVEKAREISRTIKDAFLSGIDYSDASSGTEILSKLNEQAARADAFVIAIRKLRKAGLNARTLNELTAGGPEQSLAAAQQLLAGRADTIQAVNKAVKRIAADGASLGNSEAKARTGFDPNGPNMATVRAGDKKVTVEFDFGGAAEGALVELIRKAVKTKGRGNVQVAFGTR